MKSLAIDLGSYQYKAMYNGQEYKYPAQYVRGHQRDIIGQAFLNLPLQQKCEVWSPFSGPYPLNFETIKNQLQEFLIQMQIDPTITNVKVSVPPFTPTEILQELDKLLLDVLCFNALYRNTSLHFIQYAPDIQQRMNKEPVYVVFDIGHSQQHVACCAFRNIIQSTIRRNDCGSLFLQQQLSNELKNAENQFFKKIQDTPLLLQQIFQQIMQESTQFYITQDQIVFEKQDNSVEFCDQNGYFISLMNQFASPSTLNQLGSLQLLQSSLQQTNSSIKQTLKTVFVTGGLSKLKFVTRLNNDLMNHYDIVIVEGGEFGICRGISAFDDTRTRVKRSEYLEQGYEIIRRRFG